ncbi:hypothetical protein ACF3M2_21220, partial (plasmid) [Tissierella carlieri]
MIRAIMDYDNAEATADKPLIRPVARKKSMGNVDAGMMRLGELEVEKDEIDKVDYVEPTAPEYSLKAKEMLRA